IAVMREVITAVHAGPNAALRRLGYLITMRNRRLGIHTVYERTLREWCGPKPPWGAWADQSGEDHRPRVLTRWRRGALAPVMGLLPWVPRYWVNGASSPRGGTCVANSLVPPSLGTVPVGGPFSPRGHETPRGETKGGSVSGLGSKAEGGRQWNETRSEARRRPRGCGSPMSRAIGPEGAGRSCGRCGPWSRRMAGHPLRTPTLTLASPPHPVHPTSPASGPADLDILTASIYSFSHKRPCAAAMSRPACCELGRLMCSRSAHGGRAGPAE